LLRDVAHARREFLLRAESLAARHRLFRAQRRARFRLLFGFGVAFAARLALDLARLLALAPRQRFAEIALFGIAEGRAERLQPRLDRLDEFGLPAGQGL